jgi:hypothetical protein
LWLEQMRLEQGPVRTFLRLPGGPPGRSRRRRGGRGRAPAGVSRPAQKFSQSFACPSGDTCKNVNAGAILEADGGTNLSSFSPAGFTAFQAITNTGTWTGLAASGFWGLAKR